MENIIPEEFKRIELIYSIENILLIEKGNITLLNNFSEYYEKLEIKPIDISTFKKNNYGKGSAVRSRNGVVNGSWKRKNRFRGKDIEKFFINSYIKQLPQNDSEKIRKIVISHLNKLNDKKFTIIVKEFIDSLEEQVFYETYEIINNEIMNKVFTDNHYIYLYAKLIKELIINKKWQKKMFNIIQNTSETDEYGYYWSLNRLDLSCEKEYIGPFDTEQDAIDDAILLHNYKCSFCEFIEDKFNCRDVFLNEINDTVDEFDLNIFAKNKYFNFLKMIYWTVEYNIFNTKVLHYSLLKLLETSEIDSFIHLYDFIMENKLKFNKDTQTFYEERINNIIDSVQIIPRIKFKLQSHFKLKIKCSNIFEALALPSSNENSETTSIPIRSSMSSSMSINEQNIDCIISEYPITQDYDASIELFKEINIIDYSLFITKLIFSILDSKESISVQLFELFKMLVRDFSEFSEEFGIFICKNMPGLYVDYSIDYPKCSFIFSNLIRTWFLLGNIDKNDFINKLNLKKTVESVGSSHAEIVESVDEDELYNLELFNVNVVEKI